MFPAILTCVAALGVAAPANQTFSAIGVSGWTASTNYVSTVGTNAPAFNTGDTLIITKTQQPALLAGLESVVVNNNGATKGYNLIASGGTPQLSVYPSANACVMAGTWKKGANRIVFYNDGTNIRGTLNGSTVVVEPLGSYTVPDATCTFQFGGSVFGASSLAGLGVELVYIPASANPGGYTDAQLKAISGSVLPVPPGGTVPNLAYYSVAANGAGVAGRWYTPSQYTSIATIWFRPGVDWTTGASSVTTGGTSPVTWTVNGPGGLSKDSTTLVETIYQNIGPDLLDTITPSYSSSGTGFWTGDPEDQLIFTMPINHPDLAIGMINNDTVIGATGAEEAGLYVGAASDTAPTAGNFFSTIAPPFNDGLVHTYWNTIEAASGVSPSLHPCWFYNGAQAIHPAGQVPPGVEQGGYVQFVIGPPNLTFTRAALGKFAILDTDSVGLGMGGSYNPTQFGFLALQRRVYPTTGGPGAVDGFGYSGAMLYDIVNSLSQAAAACAARVVRSGATHVDHFIEKGINDYGVAISLSSPVAPQNVAGFQTLLQNWVNALIAAYTAVGVTYRIIIIKLIQSHYDAIANNFGDTLANYRTAQAAITGTNVLVIEGRTPGVITFNADNVHPDQPGEATFQANVQSQAN